VKSRPGSLSSISKNVPHAMPATCRRRCRAPSRSPGSSQSGRT
jgi:hypothetical protein